MSRWTTYLLRALAALADTDPAIHWSTAAVGEQERHPFVDLDDDASVRAAFRSIVEWQWGTAAYDERRPGGDSLNG